jgi:uncharacterized damage-inducible protein DinB
MNLNELILAEIKRESASTVKLLKVVPADKNDWKPHEKSFKLGRLAAHVADTYQWINRVLDANEFDFATASFAGVVCATNEELIAFHDEKMNEAIASLQKASNEYMMQEWVVRRGDFIISKGSRWEAVRHWAMNHQLHHRGQLSVYLRLLDVPIPGMYGPSADDRIAMEKAAAVAVADDN